MFWKDNGYELKNLKDESGKQSSTIRNESFNFKEGLSWGRRTERFEPHIINENVLATASRYISFYENYNEILSICSFWNSEYIDYLLKMSMEWLTRPNFLVGVINQSPYPELPDELKEKLSAETVKNHRWIEEVFGTDESSLYFRKPAINITESISEGINHYRAVLQTHKQNHLQSLQNINQWVYQFFGITAHEQTQIRNIIYNRQSRAEGLVFDIDIQQLAQGIVSWLVGCAFGRWDVRFAHQPELLPVKEDIFSPLPACSAAMLIGTDFLPATAENIVSAAWLAARKTIENKNITIDNQQITASEYPIEVLWNGIAITDHSELDLYSRVHKIIVHIWGKNSDNAEYELCELLGVNSLKQYLVHHNHFFNHHLAQYTQNKRIAPIYLPLSTPSGSFTVWLYYPRLNANTLFAVINIVSSRIEQIETEMQNLQTFVLQQDAQNINKKLSSMGEQLVELKQFKTHIEQINSLPYRPHHDDGVLITAAPLHKLFRHPKWSKATTQCWQQLQNGDFDWAHLALPIYTERVTQKCRTDLSMAIAHNLEHLCEIKPKPKKTRKTKDAELDIDE